MTLSPVTVFAALGPNPAPLVELIWALHRHRNKRVTKIFVVVDASGNDQLQRELLDADRALHELGQVLGFVPDQSMIHTRVVQAPSGIVLDDDDAAHADLYNSAIWDVARDD